ncbi:unnamed protein product [Cylicostephanus goldi]|uniref:Nucleolar protein 6 n=1 Tax=Cylicostephanus goldi TaxID=71465 RepID=A0A3P6SV03_CYLGO|nr:unnamed protein product [Cylicostephanus goldi]
MIRRVSAELRHKEHIMSALALTCRWFKCRSLAEFDDLFLASFVVRLLENNVIAKQQDLLTVLRNIFSAIVNWDTSAAIGFQPEDMDEDVLTAHMTAFDVVFLDSTGYWNIASGISKDSLLLAKADLSRSIASLGDPLAFDTLFLEQHNLFSSFDHYFKVDLISESKEVLLKLPECTIDTVDENDRLLKFVKKLSEVINNCMDERFENLYIQRLSDVKEQKTSLLLGFRIKRGWTNPLTMGPVATDPTAKGVLC